MRETINCLREFDGLNEAEQPAYMLNHGNFITTNAVTFPALVYDGAAVISAATLLFTTYSTRNTSDIAMNAYTDQKALCVTMMNSNYDGVDFRAEGDGSIVAKAGVKGTSVSTTRTNAPAKPKNVNYSFVENAGEIQLNHDVDKLSYGAVIISYTSSNVTVTKSGDMQLKIVLTDGTVIFVDLSTTIKTIIQNLTKGTEIRSAIALFNPNGISPIANPEPVIIPR